MSNSANIHNRTIQLNFSGNGGEIQFHRLNKDELAELKKNHLDAPDNFLEDNLSGGESFNESVHLGSYGIYLEDMELTLDDEPIELDIYEQSVRIKYINDDENLPDKANYYYLTKGKVYGSITIPLNQSEDFLWQNLEFHYVEYCFDQYVGDSGEIMVAVYYDGRECEIATEDNGQNIRRIITFPIFNRDNEYENYKVVLDTDEGDLVNFD